MKKQKLLLLIGGLLIMIMITACKDSKIPENRTKEKSTKLNKILNRFLSF